MTTGLCSRSRRVDREARPRWRDLAAAVAKGRELRWVALESRYADCVYDIVAERLLSTYRPPAGRTGAVRATDRSRGTAPRTPPQAESLPS